MELSGINQAAFQYDAGSPAAPDSTAFIHACTRAADALANGMGAPFGGALAGGLFGSLLGVAGNETPLAAALPRIAGSIAGLLA